MQRILMIATLTLASGAALHAGDPLDLKRAAGAGNRFAIDLYKRLQPQPGNLLCR